MGILKHIGKAALVAALGVVGVAVVIRIPGGAGLLGVARAA